MSRAAQNTHYAHLCHAEEVFERFSEDFDRERYEERIAELREGIEKYHFGQLLSSENERFLATRPGITAGYLLRIRLEKFRLVLHHCATLRVELKESRRIRAALAWNSDEHLHRERVEDFFDFAQIYLGSALRVLWCTPLAERIAVEAANRLADRLTIGDPLRLVSTRT